MTALLERQRREMDRLADRYAQPLGRFWLYFKVEHLRINVEVNEATYREAHVAAWPKFDDPAFTPPIEVTWWKTQIVNRLRVERGGWVDEP